MTEITDYELDRTDETWSLRLTWATMISLSNEWGAEEWEARFMNAMREPRKNIDDLATAIHIISGTPKDDVLKSSPPLSEIVDKLNVAWAWAHNGHKTASILNQQIEKAVEQEENTEKKPIGHFLNGLKKFFTLQWKSA